MENGLALLVVAAWAAIGLAWAATRGRRLTRDPLGWILLGAILGPLAWLVTPARKIVGALWRPFEAQAEARGRYGSNTNEGRSDLGGVG